MLVLKYTNFWSPPPSPTIFSEPPLNIFIPPCHIKWTFPILPSTILYFRTPHSTLCLPPKFCKFWGHCLFPRAFENNGLCKSWGANKVYYGEFENKAARGCGRRRLKFSPQSSELRHQMTWIVLWRSRRRRRRPCVSSLRKTSVVPLPLRTVPTIVIAHTFCASRDTRVSNRRCSIIQGYFWAVQNYAEKTELSKCSWYPKRKLGVTQNGKKTPYIALYFKAFYKYCRLTIFEKCVVSPNFLFWIPITIVKICFSRIVSKLRKNSFELVGTVLNSHK